ncbi:MULTISPECIES: DUF5684 domain-containing protein [unclassified Pseudodesulfovibrio]|uniref:DUF5684 domain-containing protein n=1 Tax=unclassified Pseudodesulfovibrio TaxID=2661612 RepID=UPI000FEC0260|nr:MULTISPECIES: DUF5684 domain-containing protein [unclassified Pseudodesulfovibrio]MCJ2164943.1 DUF5684 domain-containing protein [Pseudodesulfovibrio sp. S3-i]RWU03694.1 signal peptidase I [Pseudodesulfovibrio sp. S3]
MGTLIYLVILIAVVIGLWKMFEKAGEYGWACLIPFYNLWVLNRIGGKEWYWFVGYFIPVVNLVLLLLLSFAIAKKFGLPIIFGVGIFLLPFVFYPILGFGDARYQK